MKIVIATGGSGGHIFPAILTAEELRKRGNEIIFVGTFGVWKDTVAKYGFLMEELPARGLSGNSIVYCFVFLHAMFKSIIQSFRLFNRLKPDAVLGFGGYGAFPFVFVSAFLRVPAVIHEQNVYPGRANKLLSRMVKRIAVSFTRSRDFFSSGKTVVTGCPCRVKTEGVSKEELLKKFGLDNKKFTILVLGGSQGSHRINSEFIRCIPELKKDLDFQVIHVSGDKDYERLNNEYKQMDIKFYLTAFLDAIEEAYGICDLALSRAGAVTVHELAAFCIPCILVPYPYAGGHQRLNADSLAEIGLADILEEKELSAERLKEAIFVKAREGFERSTQMMKEKEFFNPHAAQNLANEVMNL